MTVSMKISESAYAKLNLSLRIVSRLENGYHGLETVMVPLEIHDQVELEFEGESSKKFLPQVSTQTSWVGELERQGWGVPSSEENLTTRAARAFFQDPDVLRELDHFPGHVRISINKQIPMGGGLGGGSANAAAVFRGLLTYFGLENDASWMIRIREMAAKLGADIPFLVDPVPAVCTGIGEKMAAVPWAGDWEKFHVLLVCPPVGVSTPEAYRAWDDSGKTSKHHKFNTLDDVLVHGLNDFEQVVFPRYPQFSTVLNTMKEHGALAARMSGSGSTLFAVAENEEVVKNIDFQVRNILSSEYENAGWYSIKTTGLRMQRLKREASDGHHRSQNFSSYR